MKCTAVPIHGGVAFLCGSRAPRRRCSVPGCTNWADRQCDFPVKARKSKTCDAYLCDRCAKPAGENLDHCPPHAKQGQIPAVG